MFPRSCHLPSLMARPRLSMQRAPRLVRNQRPQLALPLTLIPQLALVLLFAPRLPESLKHKALVGPTTKPFSPSAGQVQPATSSFLDGQQSVEAPLKPSSVHVSEDPKGPKETQPKQWVNLFKENRRGYLHGSRLKYIEINDDFVHHKALVDPTTKPSSPSAGQVQPTTISVLVNGGPPVDPNAPSSPAILATTMAPVCIPNVRAKSRSQDDQQSVEAPLKPSPVHVLEDPKGPKETQPKQWVNLFKENPRGYLNGSRLKYIESQVQVHPPLLRLGFEFEKVVESLTPVWVRFERLGPHLWSDEILGGMPSKIGVPIHTDMLTRTKEKLEYARVLIEIDLNVPLKSNVPLKFSNGKVRKYDVFYENLPTFCTRCKSFKHATGSCKVLSDAEVRDKAEEKGPCPLAVPLASQPIGADEQEAKGSPNVSKELPPAVSDGKAQIEHAKSPSSCEESEASASITINSDSTACTSPSSVQGSLGVEDQDEGFKVVMTRKQRKTSNDNQVGTLKRKPFKFHNMIADHKDFLPTVKSIWDMNHDGFKQFQLCSKLKALKAPLRLINKHHFSHISIRAKAANEELKEAQEHHLAYPTSELWQTRVNERRITSSRLARAEYLFYAQIAKSTFTLESDRCSKIFHGLVKRRVKRNHIARVEKDSGSFTSSEEEMVFEV
ncbi:hypothetical protein V2J09_018157 [Rumex salicifolius]